MTASGSTLRVGFIGAGFGAGPCAVTAETAQLTETDVFTAAGRPFLKRGPSDPLSPLWGRGPLTLPSPPRRGRGNQAGLTKDRALDWHGNIAGMHRNSDSAAVWMNVPGVATALPAVHKTRPFKSSDDFSGSERSKRHGEEA